MATPSQPYVFAFNGWLFGGTGQGVQVLSVDGLEDLPTLRTQDEGRGYADGMFTGRDFLNGRTVVMQLQIMNDANGTMNTYIQQLKQYLISQTQGVGTLQIYLPNRGVQRLYARVRRRSIRIDPDYTYGKSYATVEFFCPDPRVYNDIATTTTISLSSSKYRIYPKTFSYTYSYGTGSGTSATFTNAGNYVSYPTITIVGPCTAPKIISTPSGNFLSFPTTTLTSSDAITIDTDLRTILLNGVAARNLLSTDSKWFGFDPQVATTVYYTSTAGIAGQATISFRDAYI